MNIVTKLTIISVVLVIGGYTFVHFVNKSGYLIAFLGILVWFLRDMVRDNELDK
jgi:hypothetical protein